MSDNDRYVAKSEDELKKLAENCFYEKNYEKLYDFPFCTASDRYTIKIVFIDAFIAGYRTKRT